MGGRVRTIFLLVLLGSTSYVHAKHDSLWSHGGHLVAEAVLVNPFHVGRKRVLATGLALSGVHNSVIRPHNLGKEEGKYVGLAWMDWKLSRYQLVVNRQCMHHLFITGHYGPSATSKPCSTTSGDIILRELNQITGKWAKHSHKIMFSWESCPQDRSSLSLSGIRYCVPYIIIGMMKEREIKCNFNFAYCLVSLLRVSIRAYHQLGTPDISAHTHAHTHDSIHLNDKTPNMECKMD